jgi:hypothetical protein
MAGEWRRAAQQHVEAPPGGSARDSRAEPGSTDPVHCTTKSTLPRSGPSALIPAAVCFRVQFRPEREHLLRDVDRASDAACGKVRNLAGAVAATFDDGPLLEGQPTISDNGKCRLRVNGAELERGSFARGLWSGYSSRPRSDSDPRPAIRCGEQDPGLKC